MNLYPIFQVENKSGELVIRWVNAQLRRIEDWVKRTIQQEVISSPMLSVVMLVDYRNLWGGNPSHTVGSRFWMATRFSSGSRYLKYIRF